MNGAIKVEIDGMDEGKSIVDRKNAEISARGELVKERVNTVKDILSNPDKIGRAHV